MGNIRSLGVMVDCSRDAVYTVGSLKKYISLLAKMGYNSLQLYTEDTYEADGEPQFGYLRGRYSKAELKELTAAYQRRVDDKYPPLPQVRPRRAVPSTDEADLAYLI